MLATPTCARELHATANVELKTTDALGMTLQGWVDRQIPDYYQQRDPDVLRRARVIVLFCAVLLWYIPVPILQNAWLKNWGLVSFYLSLWLFARVVPQLLRYSCAVAGNGFVVVWTSGLSIIAYTYGGQAASQATLLCITPMVALMMAGRRSATVWFGITLALGLLIVILSANGFVWPRPAGLAFQRFWLTGYVASSVLVYAFASLYETAKEQMRVGLASANAELRVVLDNLGQGFLNVDLYGQLASQRSAIVDRWFGAPQPRETLWAWLAQKDPHFGKMLEVAWQQLIDDFLPMEVSLDMLPRRFVHQNCTYGLDYQPIPGADRQPTKFVVVISDITAKLEADRAETLQRELTQVFERITHDRTGFLQFWNEGAQLVRELRAGTENELRTLHTLKGNSLIFGVRSVADCCHELESALQESNERASAEQLERVTHAWDAFTERVHSLVETDSNYLAVSTNDYREICDAIRRRSGHDELSVMLAAWRDEPTSIRFTRMAEQAQRMAERIGKTISVDIDHGGVRLDPQRFGSVWSALMHAVRNAVDHGLEAAPERASAEKAGLATLTLASRIVDGDVVLEISDNGRGIDWDKVQKKASALAVPCATPAELEAALFHDGVSTKEGVTEISGRGVGMGALKALCESLGGHVRLESESGQGTRLAVYIPLAAAHGARAA